MLGRIIDSSAAALVKGYAWLPDRRRASRDGVAETRLMGRRATGLCGPDAVRFIYDEANIRRSGAIPGFVQDTLFGRGSLHSLDDGAHRRRKAMFLDLLASPGHVVDLVASTGKAWDAAVPRWCQQASIVLFDEAARVLTRGVCDWAAIPVEDEAKLARDLVAMVDGFASGGPRHFRARRARQRRERWLADLVIRVRDGRHAAPAGSVLHAVANHRQADGELLSPRTAAVEVLNVIRPDVAVCWFVAYIAHALHRWPHWRDRLARGDEGFAVGFAHEVRRFYPFAPFIGGLARRELSYRGHRIPEGSMVLLDLYGQNHDASLWPDPYAFLPTRFEAHAPGAYDLVPQGGGDPATGHRCPGEPAVVALLADLSVRLARLDYTVPRQDMSISLRRVPARPRSGMRISVGSGGEPNYGRSKPLM
jgi:fatty-acid peroxygenase